MVSGALHHALRNALLPREVGINCCLAICKMQQPLNAFAKGTPRSREEWELPELHIPRSTLRGEWNDKARRVAHGKCGN
jgi:hypothetical protein